MVGGIGGYICCYYNILFHVYAFHLIKIENGNYFLWKEVLKAHINKLC